MNGSFIELRKVIIGYCLNRYRYIVNTHQPDRFMGGYFSGLI